MTTIINVQELEENLKRLSSWRQEATKACDSDKMNQWGNELHQRQIDYNRIIGERKAKLKNCIAFIINA